MSAPLDWLMRYADTVPPALHQRMLSAAGDVAEHDAGVPQVLGAAAVACLKESMQHYDERAAALPLLAADALITAACEAAAEEGVDTLIDVCAEYDTALLSARCGLRVRTLS